MERNKTAVTLDNLVLVRSTQVSYFVLGIYKGIVNTSERGEILHVSPGYGLLPPYKCGSINLPNIRCLGTVEVPLSEVQNLTQNEAIREALQGDQEYSVYVTFLGESKQLLRSDQTIDATVRYYPIIIKNPKAAGKFLEEERIRLGLSPAGFAAKIEVSIPTLYRWTNGKLVGGRSIRPAIAFQKLGISVERLEVYIRNYEEKE